ncbi:hypothetical protein [Stappia albiluteola]|nr:hypothetical protein [Stappia albiluteola]
MSNDNELLSTDARRILHIYEMYFSLTFRFMEEYKVKEFSQLMILTTIAIANANNIEADIDLISEETEIPYSTVRRRVEKMCLEGVLQAIKAQNKIIYRLSNDARSAHPDQTIEKINNNFRKEVMDIVIDSLDKIILERK